MEMNGKPSGAVEYILIIQVVLKCTVLLEVFVSCHIFCCRSTFSPIFSSGKLKKMMPIIKVLNSKIEDNFSKYASNGDMFELKHELGKYSMDAIASSAFGVDALSLSSGQNESEFVKYAKAIFTFGPLDFILLFFLLPFFNSTPFLSRARNFLVTSGIAKFLQFPNLHENMFFINVVGTAIKQRRETKKKRNDLIDMMIEALDSPAFSAADEDDHATDQYERDSKIHGFEKHTTKLNDDYIIATAMILLQVGYDSTALTMSNAVYELTLNPECQRRLQEELSDANINDYSVLQNLPYLDAVLHETLRVHPIIPNLAKICTREYKVPGTSLTIKPGDSIEINATGIHHDPKYYTNPESFDPENFTKERKAERDPLTFMGFNQGPRSCIAMRFALLEMKICLSHLLTNFNFISCEKTTRNWETAVDSFLGGIKGGAWVRCERR